MPAKITLTREAVAALRSGNKIEAIKLMRETSGIGLAEAKAVVEAFEKVSTVSRSPKIVAKQTVRVKRDTPHVASQPDGLSPGEVPRSSGAWRAAAAIAVAIAAAIAWVKLR